MCAPEWTTPSISMVNSAGLNRESVLTRAATYVPVLPRRTDIALAASLTSESNPQLPIATYRRVASAVATFAVSMRTVGPSAQACTAASRFLRPIACAKSSAVPDGKTASVASVPAIPLAARPTVPSPPRHPTRAVPAAAAARTRSSRSGPDVDNEISCGMPASASRCSNLPITLPALPLPAVGFATTTSGAAPIAVAAPLAAEALRQPARGAAGRLWKRRRQTGERRDVRVAGPTAGDQILAARVGDLGLREQFVRVRGVVDRHPGEPRGHGERSQSVNDLGLDRRDQVGLGFVEPVVGDRGREVELRKRLGRLLEVVGLGGQLLRGDA